MLSMSQGSVRSVSDFGPVSGWTGRHRGSLGGLILRGIASGLLETQHRQDILALPVYGPVRDGQRIVTRVELVDTGIDCLILGCTHYPLIAAAIQETVGTRIEVLDSALWTAREAHEILVDLGALAPEGADGFGASEFHVTDMTDRFSEQAARFLGRELGAVQLTPLEELVATGGTGRT